MKALMKIVMAIILIGVAYPVMAQKDGIKHDKETTTIENNQNDSIEKCRNSKNLETIIEEVHFEYEDEDKITRITVRYRKDGTIEGDTVIIYRRIGKRIGEPVVRQAISNMLDGFIYPGIGIGETFEIINKIIDNKLFYLNNLRKYYPKKAVNFMDYNIEVARKLRELKYKKSGNDAPFEYFETFNKEYPLFMYLFYKKHISPEKFVESLIQLEKIYQEEHDKLFDKLFELLVDTLPTKEMEKDGEIVDVVEMPPSADTIFGKLVYPAKQIAYQKVLGPELGKEVINMSFINTTEIKEGELYKVKLYSASAEDARKKNYNLLDTNFDFHVLFNPSYSFSDEIPYRYMIPLKIKMLYPDSIYCIIAFSSFDNVIPYFSLGFDYEAFATEHFHISRNLGCFSIIVAKKDSGGNFLFNEIFLENEEMCYPRGVSNQNASCKNLLYSKWPFRYIQGLENMTFTVTFDTQLFESAEVCFKKAVINTQDKEKLKKEVMMLYDRLAQNANEKNIRIEKEKRENYMEYKTPILVRPIPPEGGFVPYE